MVRVVIIEMMLVRVIIVDDVGESDFEMMLVKVIIIESQSDAGESDYY